MRMGFSCLLITSCIFLGGKKHSVPVIELSLFSFVQFNYLGAGEKQNLLLLQVNIQGNKGHRECLLSLQTFLFWWGRARRRTTNISSSTELSILSAYTNIGYQNQGNDPASSWLPTELKNSLRKPFARAFCLGCC